VLVQRQTNSQMWHPNRSRRPANPLLSILLFVHMKHMLHFITETLFVRVHAMSAKLVEMLVSRSTTLHSTLTFVVSIPRQII
jgi:hypothetical protein